MIQGDIALILLVHAPLLIAELRLGDRLRGLRFRGHCRQQQHKP